MFGLPDDTEEIIKKTIQYSKFLPNQLVQFSVFTPYPGTPSHNELSDKIIVQELEKYNQYNLIYKHKFLNNEMIIKLKNIGYRKFYLNLRNLFVIFLSLTSFFRK
jgi:anaerobic magnesium-protoporphyrin IX monomethyl ester cyclase